MKIAHSGGGVRAAAIAVLDGRTFRARLGYQAFGPEVTVRLAGIDVEPEKTPPGREAAKHLARILAANVSNKISIPLVLSIVTRDEGVLVCDVEIQLPFASNRRQRRRKGPGPVSGRMTADAAEEMVKNGHAVRAAA